MYPKGGNMLHTIRQLVNDDDKWRKLLLGLNRDFARKTVTTQQIESYISESVGIDLSKIFDQYLRTTKIPRLQYKIDGKTVTFKYDRVVPGFAMPIRVNINRKDMTLAATDTVQTMEFPEAIKSFTVDPNYYVDSSADDFVQQKTSARQN
jgi:aminopeptidase N